MKIYAIYRMYYGEDFIKASIFSIFQHVDKIFVFAPQNSFGDVHKGRVDNSLQLVRSLEKEFENIHVIENEEFYIHPRNQFTNLYNHYIKPKYKRPDAIICIEPDMVWDTAQMVHFLFDFAAIPIFFSSSFLSRVTGR